MNRNITKLVKQYDERVRAKRYKPSYDIFPADLEQIIEISKWGRSVEEIAYTAAYVGLKAGFMIGYRAAKLEEKKKARGTV